MCVYIYIYRERGRYRERERYGGGSSSGCRDFGAASVAALRHQAAPRLVSIGLERGHNHMCSQSYVYIYIYIYIRRGRMTCVHVIVNISIVNAQAPSGTSAKTNKNDT